MFQLLVVLILCLFVSPVHAQDADAGTQSPSIVVFATSDAGMTVEATKPAEPILIAPTPVVIQQSPIVLPEIKIEAVSSPKKKHNNIGFGLDIGVPDILAIGLVVKPNLPWLRFQLAATYNALAPGIRGGATIDPIDFAISPSFTIEAGHNFFGDIPTKQAKLDETYYNFHLGIELGSQTSFRFFIHGGASYYIFHGNNLESLFDNTKTDLTINNISLRGWVLPTGKLGIICLF